MVLDPYRVSKWTKYTWCIPNIIFTVCFKIYRMYYWRGSTMYFSILLRWWTIYILSSNLEGQKTLVCNKGRWEWKVYWRLLSLGLVFSNMPNIEMTKAFFGWHRRTDMSLFFICGGYKDINRLIGTVQTLTYDSLRIAFISKCWKPFFKWKYILIDRISYNAHMSMYFT